MMPWLGGFCEDIMGEEQSIAKYHRIGRWLYLELSALIPCYRRRIVEGTDLYYIYLSVYGLLNRVAFIIYIVSDYCNSTHKKTHTNTLDLF